MPPDSSRQTDVGLKCLLSANTSWNIVNFRAGLVRALRTDGFKIIAASPVDAHTPQLATIGCRHLHLAMDNKGTNPVEDSALLLRYLKLMQRERPDIYLGWTIKPNIYGSLAAHLLGVPVVNNISGLGTAFLSDGWLTPVVKLLYRVALHRSACVFFQNCDDRDLFIRSHLVRPEQVGLLPGSGIDLTYFSPTQLAPRETKTGPIFILVARLLWDKGIGEYVEAARILKKVVPHARFRLLGFLDVDNRSAIPRDVVQAWVHEGVIEYLGHADDVRPHVTSADCVVLPSYREGTPRSLLEAAAMGKPLIATDAPGCRDVVDDGVNGWLCKPRDANELAEKMLRFTEMSESQRHEMGHESRLKAEREFDEQLVIDAYFSAIRRAVQQK